ncbi:hypothetical protein D1872_197770 [compost metagenome]
MEIEVICSSITIIRIAEANKNAITVNPAVPSLAKYGLVLRTIPQPQPDMYIKWTQ